MYGVIDMRHAPRDERGQLIAGEGGFFAPSCDGQRHVTFPRKPSLEERIYTAVQRGGLVSRAEIASALKLVKASWLNQRIEQMVSEGRLQRHNGRHINGFVKYLYEVAK